MRLALGQRGGLSLRARVEWNSSVHQPLATIRYRPSRSVAHGHALVQDRINRPDTSTGEMESA